MRDTNMETTSLRDAKYHLALSKPSPDATLLDELVQRFPEHAAALTEFAIALALDTVGAPDEEAFEQSSSKTSSAVSKAMSRFQNRLYAENKASPPSFPKVSIEGNPFKALQRRELRTFARNINANLAFVIKLRDRQIQRDTMSEGFQRRVGQELNAPLEVVIAHFAAPPEIHVGLRFKSESRPETGEKQTFEEAVRSSALTAEQQEFLLNL